MTVHTPIEAHAPQGTDHDASPPAARLVPTWHKAVALLAFLFVLPLLLTIAALVALSGRGAIVVTTPASDYGHPYGRLGFRASPATSIGRFLMASNLNRLPEIVNLMRGDKSLTAKLAEYVRPIL